MNSNDNKEHTAGEKALLGAVCAGGVGLLLWKIQQGSGAALFFFILLFVWAVATYTRIIPPWVAVILAGAGAGLAWVTS